MTPNLDIYRSANEFIKLHGLGAVIRIPKYAQWNQFICCRDGESYGIHR